MQSPIFQFGSNILGSFHQLAAFGNAPSILFTSFLCRNVGTRSESQFLQSLNLDSSEMSNFPKCSATFGQFNLSMQSPIWEQKFHRFFHQLSSFSATYLLPLSELAQNVNSSISQPLNVGLSKCSESTQILAISMRATLGNGQMLTNSLKS